VPSVRARKSSHRVVPFSSRALHPEEGEKLPAGLESAARPQEKTMDAAARRIAGFGVSGGESGLQARRVALGGIGLGR
jgi:hypothetical protein